MRTFKILGILAVAFLAILVSGKVAQEIQYQSEIREKAISYVECEDECRNEEVEVLVLGSKAVPVLSEFLLNGPPANRRQAFREHLEKTAEELGLSELEKGLYVEIYLGNYIALYQIRSAKMLGQIGGPQAKRALERALQELDGEREDVLAEIQKAIFLAEHQTFE